MRGCGGVEGAQPRGEVSGGAERTPPRRDGGVDGFALPPSLALTSPRPTIWSAPSAALSAPAPPAPPPPPRAPPPALTDLLPCAHCERPAAEKDLRQCSGCSLEFCGVCSVVECVFCVNACGARARSGRACF